LDWILGVELLSRPDNEEDCADDIPPNQSPDEDVVIIEVLEELHVSKEEIEDHEGISASCVLLKANTHELKETHSPDVGHDRIEVESIHKCLIGLHRIESHADTSEPKLVIPFICREHHVERE
jgi:hypothetical protein